MTGNNYFCEATRLFDEAYEMLEQNKPEYSLIAARKSLEAIVHDQCFQHNVDTKDPSGYSYSLEALINQLIEAGHITGENVERVKTIRVNGNQAAHLSKKANTDSHDIAHHTLQTLALILDSFAPTNAQISPLQRICMAEEYAEAGKITKAEKICQNILQEYHEDILLCARTLCCLCKICGRNAEGVLITSKTIDQWVCEGNEIAIAARLLQRTIFYERIFNYAATEEIEIGQSVYGYVVGRGANNSILVDFGYKYIGFCEKTDDKKTGDTVVGIVDAQTEDGIRLSKVQIRERGHHAVVYAAMNELKSLFEFLENMGSSVTPHFREWIDNKTQEYDLVCKLVPVVEEERLRQEELERQIRLQQEEEERVNRQRREEEQRIRQQQREEQERINQQKREEYARMQAKAKKEADRVHAEKVKKHRRRVLALAVALLVLACGHIVSKISKSAGNTTPTGQLSTAAPTGQISTTVATKPDTRFDISTPDDLKKLVNSDGSYNLKNDIDMMGAEMEPIAGFCGTLNGNGYSIKNIKIIGAENNTGFFSVLSGKVTNLHLDNITVEVKDKRENVGILCGQLNGVVSDIYVSGSVNAPKCNNVGGVIGFMRLSDPEDISDMSSEAIVTGNNYVGGIFGQTIAEDNISIQSLINNGTVTASGDYVGGLFGQVVAEGDISIELATNSGTITATGDYVGGLCGYIKADDFHARKLTVADCGNTGNVSGESHVGGLFGGAYSNGTNSTISDCTSAANITGTFCVGGLAGWLNNITMMECCNAGSVVTATGCYLEDGVQYAYVGGFAGKGFAFSECTNEAPVDYTGRGRYVGGIAGYVPFGTNGIVYGLKNTANISGADFVGGIFGEMSDFAEVSETSNTGNVTGTGSYVGGLFGQAAADGDVSVESVSNSGTITAAGDYVGGLCGYIKVDNFLARKLTVTNSSNTGDVSGESCVGGLFGGAYSNGTNSTISDCTSAANITGTFYVGGFAGWLSNITMVECSNAGSVVTAMDHFLEDGVQYAYVGGFAGKGFAFSECTNEAPVNYTGRGRYVGGIAGYVPFGTNGIVYGLKNTANISGADFVGGIFGEMSDFAEVSETSNTGNVTGTGSYVGGLFGQAAADGDVSVESVSNSGTITAAGDYVGGLCGYIKVDNFLARKLTVTGCSNAGDVSGKEYVGGLFGYAYTNGDSTISKSLSSGMISGTLATGEIAGKLVNVTIEEMP